MRYVHMTMAYGTREEIIADIKAAYTPGRSERRKSEIIQALIEIEDEGAMSASMGERMVYFVEEPEESSEVTGSEIAGTVEDSSPGNGPGV